MCAHVSVCLSVYLSGCVRARECGCVGVWVCWRMSVWVHGVCACMRSPPSDRARRLSHQGRNVGGCCCSMIPAECLHGLLATGPSASWRRRHGTAPTPALGARGPRAMDCEDGMTERTPLCHRLTLHTSNQHMIEELMDARLLSWTSRHRKAGDRCHGTASAQVRLPYASTCASTSPWSKYHRATKQKQKTLNAAIWQYNQDITAINLR